MLLGKKGVDGVSRQVAVASLPSRSYDSAICRAERGRQMCESSSLESPSSSQHYCIETGRTVYRNATDKIKTICCAIEFALRTAIWASLFQDAK